MRVALAMALLLVGLAAPARAGTLYSIPATGGKATVIAREAGMTFGPLCRRADGAFMALTESREGRRRFGTFVPSAKPRWRSADEYLLWAHFSPGCGLVAEVHYAFDDDRRGRGGVLVRAVGGDELARRTTVEPGEPQVVAWSPDASRFAVIAWKSSRRSTLQVVDARTGRVLARHKTFGDLRPRRSRPMAAKWSTRTRTA